MLTGVARAGFDFYPTWDWMKVIVARTGVGMEVLLRALAQRFRGTAPMRFGITAQVERIEDATGAKHQSAHCSAV